MPGGMRNAAVLGLLRLELMNPARCSPLQAVGGGFNRFAHSAGPDQGIVGKALLLSGVVVIVFLLT